MNISRVQPSQSAACAITRVSHTMLILQRALKLYKQRSQTLCLLQTHAHKLRDPACLNANTLNQYAVVHDRNFAGIAITLHRHQDGF